jgi:hypothetical protein
MHINCDLKDKGSFICRTQKGIQYFIVYCTQNKTYIQEKTLLKNFFYHSNFVSQNNIEVKASKNLNPKNTPFHFFGFFKRCTIQVTNQELEV